MTLDSKPQIGLLIVDLDNTLWDWLTPWSKAMTQLLNEISTQTSVPLDKLNQEVRALHQTKGTVEYSFFVSELPSLRPFIQGATAKARYKNARATFDKALHRYYSTMAHETQLYPSVLSTLLTIRAAGVTIVAYSESGAFHARRRVKRNGLDGVI
ncbi:MAG: hypothetical protein LBL92_04740, partial [Propionibacteriaceae bacterium]|nr:hypothetical protein [Propionibacteriaceae bacterium]